MEPKEIEDAAINKLNEVAKECEYNVAESQIAIDKSIKKRDYFLTINVGAKCHQDGKATYENMREYLYVLFDNIVYACWDEEVGDNGNVHLHLFVSFRNPIGFGSMIKKFEGAHIEPKKGSAFFAVNYIRKPKGLELKGREKSHTQTKPMLEMGDFDAIAEKGLYNKDGALLAKSKPKPSINDQIEALIEKYETMQDIAAADPYLFNTYGKTIAVLLEKKKLDRFKKSPLVEEVHGKNGVFYKVHKLVYYIYGQEGSGKSFSTHLEYGELGQVGRVTFDKGVANFDNYHGEPVMYLNEFKGNIPLSSLQNLLEEGLVMLDARYTDHQNLATTYIFDSNIPFEKLYSNVRESEPDKYRSFVRRITGGVWETYQTNDGIRYIALHEELLPKSCRYGDKYDPSKLRPPFSEEWTGFKHITLEQLNKIKTYEARYVYTEEKGQQVLRKDYLDYNEWTAEKTARFKLSAEEAAFLQSILANPCKQFHAEMRHIEDAVSTSSYSEESKLNILRAARHDVRFKYKKDIRL